VGGPDLRFHDLRHPGAVLAAATAATLAELMARDLGDEDIKVLMLDAEHTTWACIDQVAVMAGAGHHECQSPVRLPPTVRIGKARSARRTGVHRPPPRPAQSTQSRMNNGIPGRYQREGRGRPIPRRSRTGT
jgi:hypothetical protein